MRKRSTIFSIIIWKRPAFSAAAMTRRRPSPSASPNGIQPKATSHRPNWPTKRKQFDTAEEQLRRAIELAPRQVGRLFDLARYLAKHGRIQESEAAFDKAEQLAPNSPKVDFARAGIYVEQKRNLDRARALLMKYLGSDLTPDDPPREQAEKLLQGSFRRLMYFGESLRFTLQALRANKFRTFLTGLGLVIGNASVILVVTISITSRDYILDQIRGVGSNLIYAQYSAGTNTATKVDADFIKLADVDAVRRQFGGRIVAATGVMNNRGRLLVNGKEQDVSVIGTDEYYPVVRNMVLLSGHFIDESDVKTRQHVAMLTEKLAVRLYANYRERHWPGHQAVRVAVHGGGNIQRADQHVRDIGNHQRDRSDADHGDQVCHAGGARRSDVCPSPGGFRCAAADRRRSSSSWRAGIAPERATTSKI